MPWRDEIKMTESAPSVQELIKSISDKLAANRELIAKAKSGRLDWRWDKKTGTVDIKIHPEL